jgi:hypothetical protein
MYMPLEVVMKKLLALILILAFSVPAFANGPVVPVEGDQVLYLGGTAKGLTADTMGKFNTADNDSITFEYSGGKFAIPYNKIESFNHSKERAVRLGVIETIAVRLVKPRWYRHFIHISFRDEAGNLQAAIFEVSKFAPETLVPILRTKVDEGRKTRNANQLRLKDQAINTALTAGK